MAELRVREVFDWLSGRGPSPPAWTVQNSTQVAPEASWHRIGGGNAKEVFRATLRGGEPVILKRLRADWSWNPMGTHESARELLYLSFLHGRVGVPLLLGAYVTRPWPAHGQLVWAVQDIRGFGIGRGSGHVDSPAVMSEEYRQLAASQPVDLALAILDCFRSFSEVGGFFLQDFTPRQFVTAVSKHNEHTVLFELVDGPAPCAPRISHSLAATQLRHRTLLVALATDL